MGQLVLLPPTVSTEGKGGCYHEEQRESGKYITKEEEKVIETLRKIKSIMILPADRRQCTVILDKEDYNHKCMKLLDDTKTQVKLKKDPTKKF